jgi:hypothetical protein
MEARDVGEWWDRPWRTSGADAVEGSAAAVPAPPDPGLVCSWCSAVSAPGSERCVACGAAIAQPGSLDGLAIPGVTVVDPEILRHGASVRPAAQSPSLAGSVIPRMVGQVAGPTAGMAAAAAMLAAESIGGALRTRTEPTGLSAETIALLAAIPPASPTPPETADSPWPDDFVEPNTLSGTTLEPNTLSGTAVEPNTLSDQAE